MFARSSLLYRFPALYFWSVKMHTLLPRDQFSSLTSPISESCLGTISTRTYILREYYSRLMSTVSLPNSSYTVYRVCMRDTTYRLGSKTHPTAVNLVGIKSEAMFRRILNSKRRITQVWTWWMAMWFLARATLLSLDAMLSTSHQEHRLNNTPHSNLYIENIILLVIS